MLTTSQRRNFENLFKVFDKNGSGNIDEADFMQAFEGIKADSSPGRAEKIERAARRWFLSLYVFSDGNKDRRISQDEWLAWADGIAQDAKNYKKPSRKYEHFTAAVFAGIADSDGALTKAEYERWFHSFALKGDAAAIFDALSPNDKGALAKDEYEELIKQFVLSDEEAAGNRFFGELR